MTAVERPADLAARAAGRHVVVIGGGVSGLVAARECAKVGIRVTLLEATDAVGGAIRRAELDGVVVDVGAESYATRGGHVRTLLDELKLTDRRVQPEAGGAWLAGIPGVGAAPLPVGGILGIPANPFQDDVRRILGWSGAWRAYLDRVRPPLTIGHQLSLGALVAARMGKKVRDRLVAPVTTGVYSASPETVDVEVAAPGLNAALTRVGSLSGAVASLRADGAARKPGAAVEGLAGGMGILIDSLLDDLLRLGVEVRTEMPVLSVRGDGDGWSVLVDSDVLRADAVIVATPEASARALLGAVVPDLATVEPSSSPVIEVVTLLLDAPALDSAPRGTGALTVPGSHIAKALTHSTAKWRWLREAAGDRHVVRVSFGAQDEPAATDGLDDAAASDLARREASALLGVPLPAGSVIAAHRARYVQSQPASIIGSAVRRRDARAAVAATSGLAAVGAWLAGTGLAQVIPDATDEAERIRRALLWR